MAGLGALARRGSKSGRSGRKSASRNRTGGAKLTKGRVFTVLALIAATAAPFVADRILDRMKNGRPAQEDERANG